MESYLRRGSWLWRLGVVVWLVTIFVLSSQSDVASPVTLPEWLPLDKAAHFILYGVLGSLLYLSGATRIWAVVLTLLYGVSDEIHQAFVPGRSPELADLVADLLGASAGAWLSAAILNRWGREASR